MIISSAVYKTQCKTFLIARELAGKFSNVSSINDSLKPPYCLRVVKKYRTESGTKVVIYAVYPDQEVSQVQGALVYSSYTQPQSWSILGFFREAGEGSSTLDLVEVLPLKLPGRPSIPEDEKNTDAAINCHSKCIDCMACYSKNDTIYINEVKK